MALAAPEPGEGRFGSPLLKSIRLGLTGSYYKMSQALGLGRLQDLLGTTNLPSSSSPVHILGQTYQNETSQQESGSLQQEVWSSVLSDVLSRIWVTYREGFPPISGPAGTFTSDTGWGCTIRSGQMLLAQTLLHHLVGRHWRRPLGAECPEEVAHILGWFQDKPAQQHPFSIHNICRAGRSSELVPGRWLGPWVLCHALKACVNQVRPGGLAVHLAASPGGGAPVLYASRVRQLLQRKEDPEASQADAGSQPNLPWPVMQPAALILVPLMLGMHGKLNPRYVPQLQQVLAMPQSIGIVGGRPGSSLYFLGCQDSHVIYLDPHQVQQVAEGPEDMGSYFCSSLRCMSLSGIDPSLALGFYCRHADDLEQLCRQLAKLEAESKGAPLLCVEDGAEEPDYNSMEISSPSSSDAASRGLPGGKLDEWELM